MPIYEAVCNHCKIQFEEICKFEDIISCPLCCNLANRVVSKLADYTGINSATVDYATTKGKVKDAPTYLQNKPITKKYY